MVGEEHEDVPLPRFRQCVFAGIEHRVVLEILIPRQFYALDEG